VWGCASAFQEGGVDVWEVWVTLAEGRRRTRGKGCEGGDHVVIRGLMVGTYSVPVWYAAATSVRWEIRNRIVPHSL
jgi:hypothetical protein